MITPLGRYFEGHGLPREQSDHRAAELLESGSATATAHPAPISRPAANKQTPAAKRKRNRPTIICSPSANGPIASGAIAAFAIHEGLEAWNPEIVDDQ